MKTGKKVITRRDFLRSGSCLAVGGILGIPIIGYGASKDRPKSRVVLVRDPKVLDDQGSVRPHVLETMLDRGVKALYQTGDVGYAWKQVIGPKDVVGIKTNAWYQLPTPASLEDGVKERLLAAGVRKANLAVDDRGVRRNPVFQKSTALINMRPMRTHHWSGLGTLLKNYIMFVSKPWAYHGNACERLGAVWLLPHVKGKTRLNILVMLTPLFHGIGPHHFSRRYVWPYCGLIISNDPVAADATGARIIQAKRDAFFGKKRPISPPPLHIDAAGRRFGLGNSRPEDMELIKLGWKTDLLI
jgi:hypothetical protein